ncbi:MAG: ParB N-terminal domain-containing protein [Gammaproteobacteria bacterium]|nr:chromosome partitioning protein ParB [Gammaproteobacteria bacterium]
MATKAKSSTKRKRAPARRKTPKKAPPRTRGFLPQECRLQTLPAEAATAAERIEQEGGTLLASYYEPLSREPLLLAALPIDRVQPTPFQRDLSDAHHKKLSAVIDRTGMFLDPIIAITAPEAGFWTPNGLHRLEAMKRLGAKTIVAIVVPKREIAWQILALNTEKAHNLRERALEVIRIYKGLIEEDASRPENGFAFYLEEAALVTLGLCYERKGNFAGGSYHPILRRLLEFSPEPLGTMLRQHQLTADKLFELDERVSEIVERLKERGLVSPYLRSFVVARINPLRWLRDEPPPVNEVLRTMRERAARFNVDKVTPQDLARSGGPPEE